MVSDLCERPINSIHPDPNNPRLHPKRQIKQIGASILAFGFVNPILIDENGTIIAGHGRYLAAMLLGLTTVPTITLKGLTPKQVRGLRLADNRIAENSGWDIELLNIELQAIASFEVSFDMADLGFSGAEIDIALSVGQEPPVEDIPEPPAQPRTRPGDTWVLGPHRIGCGDCRDEAFVAKVMDGAVANVAFLDPPYNVGIADHANVKSKHREFAMAAGEMSPEDYRAFLDKVLCNAIDVSLDGAVHFVCMDWRHMASLQAVADPLYGSLLNVCVWNKSNAGMGSLYRSKHELVFVYRAGTAKHYNAIQLGRHGRHRTNVWDYPSVTTPRGGRREDRELHPTTKPVTMVADALQDVSRRGDVVLDLFHGAGTTLIAAERTGRVCRGIEIDPGYVDVAIDRWAAATGREPRRLRRRAGG